MPHLVYLRGMTFSNFLECKVFMSFPWLMCSAACYACSFVFLTHLFWLIIPALVIPVLFCTAGQWTFWRGSLWGAIAFGIHIAPLFWALGRVAGLALMSVVFAVAVAYCALQAGLFFALWGTLLKKFKNYFGLIIIFFLSLFTLFFFWMTSGFLVVLGEVEGYPCFSPLIPLARLSTVVVAHDVRCSKPSWIREVACVRWHFDPAPQGSDRDGYDYLHAICGEIRRIRSNNPDASMLVFPESALPCAVAAQGPSSEALASQAHQCDLVLGCYHACSRGECNSCFCYRDGRLALCHDKSHRVWFAEKLPWDSGFLGCIFEPLLGTSPFIQGSGVLGRFVGRSGQVFVPLICSELFFTDLLGRVAPDEVALAVVNDAWFSGTSVPDLLWTLGRIKSWWYGRQVLYVSYHHQGFFDRGGHWCRL